MYKWTTRTKYIKRIELDVIQRVDLVLHRTKRISMHVKRTRREHTRWDNFTFEQCTKRTKRNLDIKPEWKS